MERFLSVSWVGKRRFVARCLGFVARLGIMRRQLTCDRVQISAVDGFQRCCYLPMQQTPPRAADLLASRGRRHGARAPCSSAGADR